MQDVKAVSHWVMQADAYPVRVYITSALVCAQVWLKVLAQCKVAKLHCQDDCICTTASCSEIKECAAK